MGVPASGTLTIQGLHNEKNEDNYDASTVPSGPATLKDLAEGGNSGGSTVSYEATNTTSDNYPNTSTPHGMDEWYSYDHDHDPSTASVPVISLSSADSNSLTLTWDMSGVNQRVYFVLVSLFGTTLNAPLEVNDDDYKTSAGSTDLMQSGAPSKYANGTGTIPASGYPNSTIVVKARGYYNGAYSAYSSNVTGVTRPATPTSLAASSITTGGMTIGWNAPSNGANSYTYYHGTNSTATSNSSASTTNTSVAISSLSPNTTYYFAVEAVGTGGTGNITSTVSQITQLGTPTNLHQDSNTDTQIVLDWDAPGGGATSYTVVIGEVNDVSDGGNTTHTGITNTTYTKTGLESNHTYYYFVKAIGTGTAPDSAFSSSDTVYTKPGVPTSLTQSSPSTSGMTLSWTAPTNGVSNYTYYFGTNTDHDANPSATTSYTYFQKTGLSANTRYYWGVKSNSTNGGSSAVVTADNYTKPNPPPSTGFSITANTATTITFEWDAPNPGGASQYKTYYRTGEQASGTLHNTVSGTSDTINPYGGLTPNTRYWVGVQAVGPSGLLSTMRLLDNNNLYPNIYTKPTEPTSLTIGSQTITSLVFSWTAPTNGADSYKYMFIANASVASLASTVTTNSGTSVTKTGLDSHTEYAATAQSVGQGGDSTIPSHITGWTKVSPPTNLYVDNVTDTAMRLNWSAPTSSIGSNTAAPTGYNLKFDYGNSTSGSNTSATDEGTSTQVTKSGLTQGQTYYWWVEARGNGPDSGYMTGGAVLTLPAAPGSPTTTNVYANSMRLGWSAVTGATGYTVWFSNSTATLLNDASRVTTTNTYYDFTSLAGNDEYFMVVSAMNPQGTGSAAPSPYLSQYTMVGIPQNPTVSNIGSTQATLNWDAPVGNPPSTYHLRIGTYASDADNGANNPLSPGDVSGTSYTKTGLTGDTTYYWWVKSNGSPDSAYTMGEFAANSFQTKPSTPTNLSVATVSTTSVTISWTAPTGGADTYTYYFGTSASAGSNTETTNESGTSVTKTGLTPNTKYYLFVKAVNETGASSLSSGVFGYTNVTNVTNPAGSPASDTSITITWTAASGGGTYTPRTATSYGGDNLTTYSTTTGTSATITGLSPNTQYFVSVLNTGQNSSTATTSPGPNTTTNAGTPTSLSVVGYDNDSITWGFGAPSSGGASSYTYYFGTDSNYANNTATSVSNTNNITKTGLTGLTTYYFTVGAVGGNGNVGTVASTINRQTSIDDVQNVTVIDTGDDFIEIEWDEVNGAYGYKVYLLTNYQGTYTHIQDITGGNNTSLEITGLASNTKYYFGVKAVTPGSGALSANYNTWNVPNDGITAPDNPSSHAVSNVGPTTATIQWAAPSGGSGNYTAATITRYNVWYGENGGAPTAGGNFSTNSGNGAPTSLALSSLPPDTTIYWWVQAENAGGTSSTGTRQDFTTDEATTTITTAHTTNGSQFTMASTHSDSSPATNGNWTFLSDKIRFSIANAVTGNATLQGDDSDFKMKVGGTYNSVNTTWITTSSTTSQNVSVSTGQDYAWCRLKRTQYISSNGSDSVTITCTHNGVSSTHTYNVFWTYSSGRSDRRLKTDIERVGTSKSGIPIYEFRFKDNLDIKYQGTIAQDLLEMGMDEVVGTDEDGYYTVDYDNIDVEHFQIAEIDLSKK